MLTINIKGTLIDLTMPKIMGILNLTPDSFYDGGRYKSDRDILAQVERMLSEGATFIDVGGYSSRPGAVDVSEDEEMGRVVPVTVLILKRFPEAIISVDTFRSSVARRAVEAGAAMINDISAGLLDKAMLPTVAKLHVPYIMMHLRGTPRTMQQHTHYEHLVKDIMFYFSERIAAARALGMLDIIVDPGFGFAKTADQNFKILGQLEHFRFLELPVLVGLSRKSMIYKSLQSFPENALNGTSVLNTIALTKGANILRVHDVKEALECVRLTQLLAHG